MSSPTPSITKTATVAVTVKKVLVSIAITTQPAKTVYQYQESLDPTGMVVTATFSGREHGCGTGLHLSDDELLYAWTPGHEA
ncbi:MAG: hypothetical protein V8S72_09325 [Oscillospiraceae bacterium]